jgi:DNA (cytosine-5)-methyltransferase 1
VSKEKHYLYPHLKVHNAVREKLNLEDIGISIFGLNKNGKYYSSKTVSRVLGGAKKHVGKDFFTSCYYGNSQDGRGTHSIDEPINTIPCKDTFVLHNIQYAYGNPVYSSVSEPLNATTTKPKAELVTWLWDTQYKNKGTSINDSCPTIIARQDKKPLSMATAVTESFIDHSIPVPGDCKARLELKAFMRKHGITDIKIRPLYDYELAAAQGFPDSYILDESSVTRSKKFIGNSVPPGQAEANNQALYNGIKNHFLKQAV